MNFQDRKLSDLKVYENNPRNNTDAIAKVKLSIEQFGYKVPIVITQDNIIIAGHTRFAALLQIYEATRLYETIQVIVADDLSENDTKKFRIVDNQVGNIAEWDFTALRMELDDIDDFILADFGDIDGFDISLDAEDQPDTTPTDMIKFSFGAEKFEMTEAQYHEWASYIIEQKGMSIMSFIRSALEIDASNRQYPLAEV